MGGVVGQEEAEEAPRAAALFYRQAVHAHWKRPGQPHDWPGGAGHQLGLSLGGLCCSWAPVCPAPFPYHGVAMGLMPMGIGHWERALCPWAMGIGKGGHSQDSEGQWAKGSRQRPPPVALGWGVGSGP